MVFFSAEVLATLKPGNSGNHFSFRIAIIRFKRGVYRLILKNLACCDYQLATFATSCLKAQFPQNLLKILQAELGFFSQAKLRFDILRVIQQDTFRLVLITTGTACLLQIIFKRSGNIGMHHQPDVGLINPHTKSIGSHNHSELAGLEVVLDVFLFMGLEPAMSG